MLIVYLGKRLMSIIIAILLIFVDSLGPFQPSEEDAAAFLMKHREDIDTVVDYLKELEYSSAHIEDDKGIFYDLGWHDISSDEVHASVHRLRLSRCKRIDKEANTIRFELWTRTIGGSDCGLACTVDGQGTPKTHYQIYHEDLGDGWFYFYDEYEEYRAHPSQYEENQP